MNRRMSGVIPGEPLVRIEESFSAARERVFDAWINPRLLQQWFAPAGCTLEILHMDVRPGGSYHWCIQNPEFGPCWSIGTYLEVVRPELLVYTSVIANSEGVPSTPESQGHDSTWPSETIVRVMFSGRGSQTIVTLEQSVSEALARRTGALPSWLSMLDRLKLLMIRGD